jgi:hypothetical protein
MFEVGRTPTGWMIDYGDSHPNDSTIANILNLSVKSYRQILINQFNGITPTVSGEVYFETADDTKRAVEWANSVLIAVKLTEAAK